MANRVLYVIDLESPYEEVVPLRDFTAEVYRHGRLVATFKPTASQWRKIIRGKGRIRIFSIQVIR